MTHRSFRPSDFAWRNLPLILIGLPAAPMIYVLRAAGLWPEQDVRDDPPGRYARRRVALAVCFAVLLLVG